MNQDYQVYMMYRNATESYPYTFFSVLSPIVVMHPTNTIINNSNERTVKIVKDSSTKKNRIIPLMLTNSKEIIRLLTMVLICLLI